MFALLSCSAPPPEKTCADFCGTGNVCDASGRCVPLACTPACAAGTACEMGSCVAVAAVRCTEAYPGCAACDTSAATPAWVGQCGAGTTCSTATDSCVPLACTPACGPGTACQMGTCVAVEAVRCAETYPGCAACDTSTATPTWVGQCGGGTTCSSTTDSCVPLACTPACGPGTACEMGACVAVEAIRCTAPYPGCASCDLSGATPHWVGQCGQGTTCSPVGDTCVSTTTLHASLGAPGGPLHGPFPTGYAVTAACVSCHATQATEVMASQHWTWSSRAADLVAADGLTAVTVNVGKTNLINNFCVGTASNDKRCDQCHAGYGGDPNAAKPQKSARAYQSNDATTGDSSIPLANRVDCLVCHSNPTAAYAKDPKNFGNPVATLNLAVAAQDIVKPTRTNCGACHFYAGGGDNVKLMGSSLKNPTEAIDVHMGRGMECLDCHSGPAHTFKGGGIHTPGHAGRASCTDCHSITPHEGKVATNGQALDNHAVRLACQTCHIPKFSKGQFGKMDWDWSFTGDNSACSGAPGACVAGVISTKVNDDGTPNSASANAVTTYDFIKGRFVWQKNVTPAYRWSNGKGTHALISDKGNMAGMGLTPADATRLSLGEPVGSATNGKIAPFKLMKGRQPVYVDGANSFVINPNVFGPGSLWGVIQAPGFSYAAYDFDGAVAIAPALASFDANANGQLDPGAESMAALWGKILATGAVAAGQTTGVTQFAKYDGTNPGYDWRYTKLYMDLNHEVAPKAQALGANGACTDCHSAAPKLPLCELYAGRPLPFGVVCP